MQPEFSLFSKKSRMSTESKTNPTIFFSVTFKINESVCIIKLNFRRKPAVASTS